MAAEKPAGWIKGRAAALFCVWLKSGRFTQLVVYSKLDRTRLKILPLAERET